MQYTSNKYLEFCDYSQLNFWDYYTLSHKNQLTANYPLVELSMVLKQRKEFITIDDKKEYKRCRVQVQAKGVVLRDIVFGKEIKTKKQQLCKKDDFLVAEIDAKVGGYGIVPVFLENAIVSGHYFLFEINKSLLLPEFLAIVVQQQQFAKQVKSTGSTNYAAIRPYHVLGYKIPLPSLVDQEILVGTYNKKIEQAEHLFDKGNDLKREVEKSLHELLQIEEQKRNENSFLLHFIDFIEISRWDYSYHYGNRSTSFDSIYPLVKFKDLIGSFNRDGRGNSLRVTSANFPDKDYNYIGMENIEKNTGFLIDLPKVKGKEIKSQTLFVPKSFFIYGKLRPYLNKYWFNDTDEEDVICSSEFFVFDTNKDVDNEYFKYILRSKIVQDQIGDKTSGARMPRINEEIFMNISIPFPPENIQKKIVKDLRGMENKLQSYRDDVDLLKQQAQQEFEKIIFSK